MSKDRELIRKLTDLIKELRPHALWKLIEILAGSAIITSVLAAITKWTRGHLDATIIVVVFFASVLTLLVMMLLTFAERRNAPAQEPQVLVTDTGNPGDTRGPAAQLQGTAEELRTQLDQAVEERTRLAKENRRLHAEAERVSSLELRVWALLNRGFSSDIEFIMNNLKKANDPATEVEVLNILGKFLRAEQIEADQNSINSYRPVKRKVGAS